jgi:hypothetical protein
MADSGDLIPAVPVLGLDLPRPPAPPVMQRQLFRTCLLEVIGMTAVQATRLTTNGVLTAEEVAMLDMDTLMVIPLDTTPAMIKMRLKTLKTWVDTAFDAAVGQPSGTMYISDFTTIFVANCSVNYCENQEYLLQSRSHHTQTLRTILVHSTGRLVHGNAPNVSLRQDWHSLRTRMAYRFRTLFVMSRNWRQR